MPKLIQRCQTCGSTNVIKNGAGRTICKDCHQTGEVISSNDINRRTTKVNAYGMGEVSTVTHRRIRTLQDLIEVCEIDTKEWIIERWVANKWEVGAKDADDKIQVQPLFQVKAWLKPRKQEREAARIVADMVEDAKRHAPKYKAVKLPKAASFLYEIDFPDLHFGKMTWREESGQDYDIKLAAQVVNQALNRLLGYSKIFKVQRILLPLGNDFFNVDNKFDTTTGGTAQQEDTRWEKTFREGRRLAVSMVEMCLAVAPVDVIIVPGNHDEQRAFYLGDALECWFHLSKQVSVDNRALKRKYYPYGQNLIGFTHGAHEPVDKLPSIMPIEQPGLWSKAKYREWHIGDKHHAKRLRFEVEEKNGVVIRYMRSLSATDTWHFDHGFVGSQRAAEGYLWSAENGMVAQFNAVEG